MDYFNGGGNSCCCFHPNEVVVGICALCLKERLLTLASKQGHHPPVAHKDTHRSSSSKALRMKPTITLPRVFASGFFLHHLEPRPQIPDDGGSVASLEDSFISIKFEDNGHVLWDKKGAAVASHGPPSEAINGGSLCGRSLTDECKGGMSVVEHAKPQGAVRWRKRIAHLLQLARWKRSSKAGTCHVRLSGKMEVVKGRRGGWIRSLTRKRTTSSTD